MSKAEALFKILRLGLATALLMQQSPRAFAGELKVANNIACTTAQLGSRTEVPSFMCCIDGRPGDYLKYCAPLVATPEEPAASSAVGGGARLINAASASNRTAASLGDGSFVPKAADTSTVFTLDKGTTRTFSNAATAGTTGSVGPGLVDFGNGASGIDLSAPPVATASPSVPPTPSLTSTGVLDPGSSIVPFMPSGTTSPSLASVAGKTGPSVGSSVQMMNADKPDMMNYRSGFGSPSFSAKSPDSAGETSSASPGSEVLSLDKPVALDGQELPVMGTPDPENYFDRVKMHEDLFSKVRLKYSQKASQWLKSDVEQRLSKFPVPAGHRAPASTK